MIPVMIYVSSNIIRATYAQACRKLVVDCLAPVGHSAGRSFHRKYRWVLARPGHSFYQ